MGHFHLRLPVTMDRSKPIWLRTSHATMPESTRVNAAKISVWAKDVNVAHATNVGQETGSLESRAISALSIQLTIA